MPACAHWFWRPALLTLDGSAGCPGTLGAKFRALHVSVAANHDVTLRRGSLGSFQDQMFTLTGHPDPSAQIEVQRRVFAHSSGHLTGIDFIGVEGPKYGSVMNVLARPCPGVSYAGFTPTAVTTLLDAGEWARARRLALRVSRCPGTGTTEHEARAPKPAARRG